MQVKGLRAGFDSGYCLKQSSWLILFSLNYFLLILTLDVPILLPYLLLEFSHEFLVTLMPCEQELEGKKD